MSGGTERIGDILHHSRPPGGKILSEEYHLKDYLQALAMLKATKNKLDSINLCFGAYTEHNAVCYRQSRSIDYLVCQVCRAQVERPSTEWIKDFLGVL